MGSEALIIGGPSTRRDLINEINDAFSRLDIGNTAARLGPLAATGDFLEICEALGFLSPLHRGNFIAYRRNLTIPAVNQALLSAAFHEALNARPQPIPLQILIVSGTRDILTVTSTESEITVVVTRDDTLAQAATAAQPATVAQPAPRKRAARKR